MSEVVRQLNQSIVGGVFDTPEILEKYSTDNSVLNIVPQMVAFPSSVNDVQKIVQVANQLSKDGESIAITPRGSGTDETGADLGEGMILVTSKLDRLLDIDARERLVRVQSGMTLKTLNTILSAYGLTVPIAGHDDCTIGGLISKCPTDNLAGRYGGIKKYVRKLEVVLPSGEIVKVKNKTGNKKDYGDLYEKIGKLTDKKVDLINKIKKDGAGNYGYPKITEVNKNGRINLLPLFFGAEGTLGIITEVVIKAVLLPKKPMRVLASFSKFYRAKEFLESLNALRPLRLEIYDTKILKELEEIGKSFDGVLDNKTDGFVVFAQFERHKNNCLQKIERMSQKLPSDAKVLVESTKNKARLDQFEGLLDVFKEYLQNRERLPVLTNIYVPAWNLSSFVNDLALSEEMLKVDLGIYGSFATSIYSLRPKFKLDADGAKIVDNLLRSVASILKRQGGAIDGGCSGGRLKSPIAGSETVKAERELYREIKNIFDPSNIMNPEVKFEDSHKTALSHVKNLESKAPASIEKTTEEASVTPRVLTNSVEPGIPAKTKIPIVTKIETRPKVIVDYGTPIVQPKSTAKVSAFAQIGNSMPQLKPASEKPKFPIEKLLARQPSVI